MTLSVPFNLANFNILSNYIISTAQAFESTCLAFSGSGIQNIKQLFDEAEHNIIHEISRPSFVL